MLMADNNLSFSLDGNLVDLHKNIASTLDKNEIKTVSCNRTKCTKIVANVFGRIDFDICLEHIRSMLFSILVDEPTDITYQKSLALVVRYVYKSIETDQFLKLLVVRDGTALGLYSAIVYFFPY